MLVYLPPLMPDVFIELYAGPVDESKNHLPDILCVIQIECLVQQQLLVMFMMLLLSRLSMVPCKELMVFSNNMGKKSGPVITKCKESENWTKVTFKPDLAKFNMTHLEDDVVALMKKRVIDLVGCLGKTVKVELNGKRIPIKSFLDYVNLYLQSASKARLDALPGE
ncbi:DNA topoisomerase 2-like [Camellia sinensis]|uniref:DNA topoisomerase 2-like n=1 Tax=Camellia sinensis TaxID=4442 RepID=UPI0010365EF4|nr:DNA topoisomerase 2-like [Camellia sinensis]